MFIDLLYPNNYMNYNITLAHIIGLKSSVYCGELLNIYKKAQSKDKLIDGEFIKVSRKYIYERTTLTVEEQLIIDTNLSKINLITRNIDDPDLLKLDIEIYASIISNNDVRLIEDIRRKVIVESPKGVKQTKRIRTINALKDIVVCDNYELSTALRDWVDAIFDNPKGFLSRVAVEEFQNDLNNYTKGNIELAIRIVKIASIQGYKNCQWAINIYEKDNKNVRRKQNNNEVIRTNTNINKASELSDDIF